MKWVKAQADWGDFIYVGLASWHQISSEFSWPLCAKLTDSPNRHLDTDMIVKHTHSERIFLLQPRRASLSQTLIPSLTGLSLMLLRLQLKRVWVNELKRKEWKWLGVAVYTVSQSHWARPFIVYRERGWECWCKAVLDKCLTNSIKSGPQCQI